MATFMMLNSMKNEQNNNQALANDQGLHFAYTFLIRRSE